MYQTAHQNDGFNALRLYCSKLNPACLCYDSQGSKTSQGTMSDSTSQPSSRTAKSGKFGFQERSSTVTFILKFFPYRIVNLLNISSVFTEL